MPQGDPDRAASLERALLTQCFQQTGEFIEASGLEGSDFSDRRNGTLFEIGSELEQAGTLQYETVVFELDQRGLLDVAGGPPYISSVVDGAALTSTDLIYHTVEAANRRSAECRWPFGAPSDGALRASSGSCQDPRPTDFTLAATFCCCP